MTVCIAVKSSKHERMIFVADRLLSDDTTSIESALKIAPVDPKRQSWLIMFAGHAPRFSQLRERIGALLTGDDLADVIAACELAYAAELQKRIETEILLPYGWSRAAFFQNGRSMLDEYRFGAIADQIGQMDLGIELLVGGFDSQGNQHLFELSGTGVVTRIDQLGFHVIGNGRYSALGALYPFPALGYEDDFNEVVYRAIAAKFAAEQAPGVGRDTMVVSLSRNGIDAVLLTSNLEELRTVWRATERPPLPDGALEMIDKNLLIVRDIKKP